MGETQTRLLDLQTLVSTSFLSYLSHAISVPLQHVHGS